MHKNSPSVAQIKSVWSTVWLSTWPYITLISTELASYEQLAILFAFIPVISILVPIVIGNGR